MKKPKKKRKLMCFLTMHDWDIDNPKKQVVSENEYVKIIEESYECHHCDKEWKWSRLCLKKMTVNLN